MQTSIETPTDQVMPDGAWSFDGDVTRVFDDMLRRSIPQYEAMRETVHGLASRFAVEGTAIIDLGCSRGAQLAPLAAALRGDYRFIGVDVSGPMLDEARRRFADDARVEITHCDLRADFPAAQASVIFAVLTIQFTPIEHRQKIIQRIYDHLLPGGVFIFVEKILSANAELNDLMVSQYYGMKARNGYTQEQIERKRLSLEGVLVPVTARWNEELLSAAGFRAVDCFWRWMNFAGWIGVKREGA